MTMKARITHLNAPWPAGAKVGEVVHFEAGTVPAWALGKCHHVEGEHEAAHVVSPAGSAVDPLEALRIEAQGYIDRLRGEHAEQLAEVSGKLQEALKANADLQAQLDQATASGAAAETRAAELQAKLDAAATPKKK